MTGVTIDGRVLRGQRNRRAIIDAVVQLYRAGEFTPTVAQIANQAGLSGRSVFSHFGDLDTLTAEAIAYNESDFQQLIRAPIAEGPLERRVDDIVGRRAVFFEHVGPLSRAARIHVNRVPAVRRSLDRALNLLRMQVAITFAPELNHRSCTDRDTLLEALDATLGWETWDRLRTARRLEPAQSEAVVTRTCLALLSR